MTVTPVSSGKTLGRWGRSCSREHIPQAHTMCSALSFLVHSSLTFPILFLKTEVPKRLGGLPKVTKGEG